MNTFSLIAFALVSHSGAPDTSNFYTQAIPGSPASGKLSGVEFNVTDAVLEADGMSAIQYGKNPPDRVRPYKLKLHDNSGRGAKRTLYVRIQVDWDNRLDGTKIAWRPYKEGTPESNKQKLVASGPAKFDRGITKVEVSTYPEGGEARTETYREKIAARVEFGKLKDGYLPGKILITLPDGTKSTISGSFRAAYKVRHGTF